MYSSAALNIHILVYCYHDL